MFAAKDITRWEGDWREAKDVLGPCIIIRTDALMACDLAELGEYADELGIMSMTYVDGAGEAWHLSNSNNYSTEGATLLGYWQHTTIKPEGEQYYVTATSNNPDLQGDSFFVPSKDTVKGCTRWGNS